MKSKWFRLIFVICILATFSLILFGCQKDPDGPDNPNPDNPNTPEGHTHVYDTWKFDDNGHWKECECGAKDPDSESDHHLGGWSVTKAANCTEEGTREQKCECGYKKTATIPVDATKHVWDTENPAEIIVEPTCQTKGKGKYKCTLNPAHLSDEVELPVDPNAHNFGEHWEVRTEPTCLEKGVEQNPCLNEGCNVYDTRPIDKLEHQWNDTWYYDKYDAVPATCQHTGKKVRYCTRQCGTPQFEDTPIDSNNHEYKNTYVSLDNFEHKQEPSCTCKDAKEKVSRHDYIADGGKVGCSLCSFKGDSHSNGSNITYGDENGVINIKPNNAGDLLIIIPALANNKAVTVLGPGEVAVKDESGGETNTYGLFKDESISSATNVHVKDIVIPYTITRAKEGAFAIIPNLLADVGYLYFEGTPNQFDTIDFSASDWIVNDKEKEAWTRTLAFYSDKDPSTLTEDEKTAMGLKAQVHKNFYREYGKTYEYKFWHWVDNDNQTNKIPQLWDVVGGSSEGEADQDKGQHATPENEFVLSTSAVTPSSLDRRVLGVMLKAISSQNYSNGTTLVLPRSLDYSGYGKFPLTAIAKWCFNPDKRGADHDNEDKEEDWLTYSVKTIVIPDTVTWIYENAFDSTLDTVYFEGSLDTWNSIHISETNGDLKKVIGEGKVYIYSKNEPTTEQKQQKWGSDTNAKEVKYWHWGGSDNKTPTLWENGTASGGTSESDS